MEAILKFNLPEESEEYKSYTDGPKIAALLWDLRQWLRENYKYERGDISIEAADRVAEEIRSLADGLALDLD